MFSGTVVWNPSKYVIKPSKSQFLAYGDSKINHIKKSIKNTQVRFSSWMYVPLKVKTKERT
jgi:hypothetical protein